MKKLSMLFLIVILFVRCQSGSNRERSANDSVAYYYEKTDSLLDVQLKLLKEIDSLQKVKEERMK